MKRREEGGGGKKKEEVPARVASLHHRARKKGRNGRKGRRRTAGAVYRLSQAPRRERAFLSGEPEQERKRGGGRKEGKGKEVLGDLFLFYESGKERSRKGIKER